MVRSNHLDSPQSCGVEIVSQSDIGCSSTVASTTTPATIALNGIHHHHTRNISSSTSSQASSTTSTNLIADWASSSSSKGLSSIDCLEPRLKWTQDDLIHTNLSEPASSSCEDFDEDDERIKLLCGDDPDDWPDVDTGQKERATVLSPTLVGSNNRRRRIFPKPSKILQKVRRKFNWQLLLVLAVILIVTLSLSQLNNYQYGSAAGILGWNPNTTRDTAVYLMPDSHTALLEPRIMDRGKRYLLLVIVCSAVDNFNTRQTIRQTWANGSEFNYAKFFHRMHSHAAPGSFGSPDHLQTQLVDRQLLGVNGVVAEQQQQRLDSQVIFLVGRTEKNGTQQAIVEESAAFGDVIQEDFVDTYNNLTIKSVMLLKWIANFNDDADRVKYVMKCDDDSFLNVPNLVHVLLGGTVPVYKDTFKLYSDQALRRTNWLDSVSLMGYLFHSARPIRDVTSKWYAPRFMYRRKVFPNYLSGSGYVMEATQTAKELYRAALRTPIFHLEDVYVTGLCASRRYSTRPFHNPLFSFHRYAKLPCSMRGMITQHPMTATDIRMEYERLTNVSAECEQPPREVIERILSQKSSAQTLRGFWAVNLLVVGVALWR